MIKFKNLDGVEKALDNLSDAPSVEAAMKKACALVERTAKEKAPKDTGELRRSITSRLEESDGTIVGLVYTPLEYAPFVEYGTGLFAEESGRADVPWSYQDDKGNWHTTSGMKPQPFLRPALDENREEIIRLLKGALKND